MVAVNDIAAAEAEGREFVDELQAKGVRAGASTSPTCPDRSAVDALVGSVQADLGGLDVVCSNAGVADWKTVAETDAATFDRIVAVNLTGRLQRHGQAAAQAMVRRGPGRAHHLYLLGARADGLPDDVRLRATKSGIRALCESMAIELAPHGIRVNHIGPGWVLSQLNDLSPRSPPRRSRAPTWQRSRSRAVLPTPTSSGAAVVYFASSDGDYVTGAYLRVDGGFVVGKY